MYTWKLIFEEISMHCNIIRSLKKIVRDEKIKIKEFNSCALSV